MRLKELEKRLKTEPDNLGLRVTVAGMWREAGRAREAVEMYRSVALAYRERGRAQQAIAVCRSILEIAPDDAACKRLLGELLEPADEPKRRSSGNTPLPAPLPHHVADPTSSPHRISQVEVTNVDHLRTAYGGAARPGEAGACDDDLPATEGATTRPGAEERPSVEGLAQAARRISGLFANEAPRLTPFEDLANELETRQVRRVESDVVEKLDELTVPLRRDTPAPDAPIPRDSDDELTRPRERVELGDPTEPVDALEPGDD